MAAAIATRSRRPRARGGTNTAAASMVEAAKRWHVPLWVLVGVKVTETGTGSGIGEVSSAGAEGPFQFEPGTAKAAGVRDVNNFGEAANGAAKLLAAYHRQFGSWNAALEAYNGGPGSVGRGVSYTETKVKENLTAAGLGWVVSESGAGAHPVSFSTNLLHHLGEFFTNPGGAVGQAAGESLGKGEIPNPIEPITGGLSALGDFFSLLTSGETWIRLGEILGGAILFYLGLRALTGQGVSDLPGARLAGDGVRAGGMATLAAL